MSGSPETFVASIATNSQVVSSVVPVIVTAVLGYLGLTSAVETQVQKTTNSIIPKSGLGTPKTKVGPTIDKIPGKQGSLLNGAYPQYASQDFFFPPNMMTDATDTPFQVGKSLLFFNEYDNNIVDPSNQFYKKSNPAFIKSVKEGMNRKPRKIDMSQRATYSKEVDDLIYPSGPIPGYIKNSSEYRHYLAPIAQYLLDSPELQNNIPIYYDYLAGIEDIVIKLTQDDLARNPSTENYNRADMLFDTIDSRMYDLQGRAANTPRKGKTISPPKGLFRINPETGKFEPPAGSILNKDTGQYTLPPGWDESRSMYGTQYAQAGISGKTPVIPGQIHRPRGLITGPEGEDIREYEKNLEAARERYNKAQPWDKRISKGDRTPLYRDLNSVDPNEGYWTELPPGITAETKNLMKENGAIIQGNKLWNYGIDQRLQKEYYKVTPDMMNKIYPRNSPEMADQYRKHFGDILDRLPEGYGGAYMSPTEPFGYTQTPENELGPSYHHEYGFGVPTFEEFKKGNLEQFMHWKNNFKFHFPGRDDPSIIDKWEGLMREHYNQLFGPEELDIMPGVPNNPYNIIEPQETGPRWDGVRLNTHSNQYASIGGHRSTMLLGGGDKMKTTSTLDYQQILGGRASPSELPWELLAVEGAGDVYIRDLANKLTSSTSSKSGNKGASITETPEQIKEIDETLIKLGQTIDDVANRFGNNFAGAIDQVTESWFGFTDEGFNAFDAFRNAFRRTLQGIVSSFLQSGITDAFKLLGDFAKGLFAGDYNELIAKIVRGSTSSFERPSDESFAGNFFRRTGTGLFDRGPVTDSGIPIPTSRHGLNKGGLIRFGGAPGIDQNRLLFDDGRRITPIANVSKGESAVVYPSMGSGSMMGGKTNNYNIVVQVNPTGNPIADHQAGNITANKIKDVIAETQDDNFLDRPQYYN